MLIMVALVRKKQISDNNRNLGKSMWLNLDTELTTSVLNHFFHNIYSFQHTEEKNLLENIVEKGEIAQNEQFHLFSQCFLYNLYLKVLS